MPEDLNVEQSPLKDVGCTYMVSRLWTSADVYFLLGQAVSSLSRVARIPLEEQRELIESTSIALEGLFKYANLEMPEVVKNGFRDLEVSISESADPEEINRRIMTLRDRTRDEINDQLPPLLFKLESIGGHPPEVLIHQQRPLLPETTWLALSERATRDVMYAGAALVFRMATASAFHILRAVEDILNDYYESCVPEEERIKRSKRTWGKMQNALAKLVESGKVSQHIVNTLANLRENYRNPTFHPEAEYEMEGAVTLFHECCVAITRIAEAMTQKP
jgi:hypothetical protein